MSYLNDYRNVISEYKVNENTTDINLMSKNNEDQEKDFKSKNESVKKNNDEEIHRNRNTDNNESKNKDKLQNETNNKLDNSRPKDNSLNKKYIASRTKLKYFESLINDLGIM